MTFLNYAQIIYITKAILFHSFTQISDHIRTIDIEQFETLLNQLEHSFDIIGLTELWNNSKTMTLF